MNIELPRRELRRGSVAAVVLLAMPLALFQARALGTGNLQFAGSLVCVTQTSITIRQSDGILINALLPDAAGLTGKIGDMVEFIGHPLSPPVYDDLAQKARYLELDGIDFRGKPTAMVLLATLQSSAARRPTNLLQGPPAPLVPRNLAASVLAQEGDGADKSAPSAEELRLAQVRSHVLDYVEHFPNYIADEVATRSEYSSDGLAIPDPVPWHLLDQVQDQVTVVDGAEVRDHVLLNGEPWTKPWAMLPGWHWNTAFALELEQAVSYGCPTELSPGGSVDSKGETLLVYALQSPPNGCLGGYNNGFEEFYAASRGHLFVRASDYAVASMDLQVTDFPARFPVASVAIQVHWDAVTVDGKAYDMPVTADLIAADQLGKLSRVQLQFLNYRHFAASHVIHYGDADCCLP